MVEVGVGSRCARTAAPFHYILYLLPSGAPFGKIIAWRERDRKEEERERREKRGREERERSGPAAECRLGPTRGLLLLVSSLLLLVLPALLVH
jgi:hypothetical protein